MKSSWKRPKLDIPRTKGEKVWDMIGYSAYIGSIILLVTVWQTLPDQVPAHYSLGEVNRWGSKWELIILPLVGAFMILLMQTIERIPETHNYPDRLNESNAEQFYLNSRKMINQLKNICLLIFAFIIFESVSIAMSWGNRFGIAFLPMVLLGTGVPIIIGLIRQRKIK